MVNDFYNKAVKWHRDSFLSERKAKDFLKYRVPAILAEIKDLQEQLEKCRKFAANDMSVYIEHNKTVYADAGNRHPDFRYKGYTKERLSINATADQEAAWWEGYNAREDT